MFPEHEYFVNYSVLSNKLTQELYEENVNGAQLTVLNPEVVEKV